MLNILMALVTSGSLLNLGAPARADRTNNSGCYVESDSGQFYDLTELCSVSTDRSMPVLQSGDIQVTLRWATADDLDLVVVDPFGDAISFLNPTVSSGGQLDVDANAFCETVAPAPVENIFWPTGAAPSGQYSAYVVLSIPCGSTTNAVGYNLTILNQGQTATYSGVAQTGTIDESYPFSLGQ